MVLTMADHVIDKVDQRLIAALQCDGRLTAERAAEVLNLPTRAVTRRWAALLGDGDVRVVASPPRPPLDGVMLLRIRVLRGKIDAVTRALAAREDIPLIDLSAGGDQLIAVLRATPDHRDRLVFRQLPSTAAVTSVEAETVIHVYADAGDWKLDILTPDERRRLTPQGRVDVAPDVRHDPDEIDRAVITVLTDDARTSASAIARATGHPESTVRRRLTALFEQGLLHTQVRIDPRRLGLGVDANLRMRVSPKRLDQTGRLLAAHPAVHGALATTGSGNLNIAVWLRDLDHLYRFITHDLAALEVDEVDTVLIGQAVKRPGPDW
jgi:DNA-binding Lrp family transcriptional regulator